MIEKIQHYYLIVSTFALAVLAFILLRKSGQIKDLQHDLILNKVDAQLSDAVTKSNEDQGAYNDSIKKYNALRDSYNKLYGPKSPS